MLKIIEAIQGWLTHIAENNAGAIEAVTAQSEAQEAIVLKVERLEDAVSTLVGKVGQMHDSVDELNSRLGDYLNDQARKDTSIRILQSEVRKIQKAVGG